MSTFDPMILYAGSETRSNQLAIASGWYLLTANDLMDTLAQVVMIHPHLIILDASDYDLVSEAYAHLLTIQHPPIILLSDEPAQWNAPHNVCILPLQSSSSVIIDTIRGLLLPDAEIA